MDIYIASNIGTGVIRSELTKQIIQAGHQITEHPGFASYGVGCIDSDFAQIKPKHQIVFHEGDSVVYKDGQRLITFSTLEMLGTGKSLGEWLKTAEDPIAAVM